MQPRKILLLLRYVTHGEREIRIGYENVFCRFGILNAIETSHIKHMGRARQEFLNDDGMSIVR